MNVTFEQIQQFIGQAEQASACPEELDAIKACKTLKEVLQHEKAPEWAYWYARYVLKKPWPEAEEIIKTDPEWAYCYARDVLEKPWPEAEEIIKTDPEVAYRYARYVLGKPWPEAEEIA